MKKRINKFLNKKTDFIENEELRTMNDQFFYLFNEEKKMLNYLIKENIKYFFKYKKLYLVKLFLVAVFYLTATFGSVAIILITLDYFNVINITKGNPIPKVKLTIYLPITDTLHFSELSEQYNVLIFFPYDPQKDWKSYKEDIRQIETKGYSDEASYYAKSPSGLHWGRYQLGPIARRIAGVSGMSYDDFSNNPEIQEGAFLAWIRYLKIEMNDYVKRYSGKYIDGIEITESGIISMAHNVGGPETRKYLDGGGGNPPGPLKFLKVGGYNLNIE